jgi:hypothetical protein
MARRKYTARIIDRTTGDYGVLGYGTSDIDIDENGRLKLCGGVERLSQNIDTTILTERTNDPLDGISGSNIPKLLYSKVLSDRMIPVVEVYITEALEDLHRLHIAYGNNKQETISSPTQGKYSIEVYERNDDARRIIVVINVTNESSEKIVNFTHTTRGI